MQQLDRRYATRTNWPSSSRPRWSIVAGTAAGIAILAMVGLFSTAVTTQFGLFPTLFLGTVAAGCVAMQIAELTTPRHPQP